MKLNFKNVVAPALVLFAICVVVSALLGLTNVLTKDQITLAQKQKEETSRKIVLMEAENFEATNNELCHAGKNSGGETVGYVFVTESKGYGGTIKVMTGIGTDGEIQGIVILSQSETPGLGANATKSDFTDKFKQPAQPLTVVKSTAGEGQIQAMTGATVTTKAVTQAVNLAVEAYNDMKGAA